MFKWLFPDPTPDEALIAEIKQAVARVVELGTEADRRGITVWLRTGHWRGTVWLKTRHWRGSDFFRASRLTFDEAYKTSTKKLG